MRISHLTFSYCIIIFLFNRPDRRVGLCRPPNASAHNNITATARYQAICTFTCRDTDSIPIDSTCNIIHNTQGEGREAQEARDKGRGWSFDSICFILPIWTADHRLRGLESASERIQEKTLISKRKHISPSSFPCSVWQHSSALHPAIRIPASLYGCTACLPGQVSVEVPSDLMNLRNYYYYYY